MKRFKFATVLLILLSIIFSFSCVSKDIQVTENYTETEYREKSYTVLENEEIRIPHTKVLYQINKEINDKTIFILFNKSTDGSIYWSQMDLFGAGSIESFKPELNGRDHRIEITGTEYCGTMPLATCLHVGRDHRAIAQGFNPLLPDWVKQNQEKLYYVIFDTTPTVTRDIVTRSHTGYEGPSTKKTTVGNDGSRFYFFEMFERDSWALIDIGGPGTSCSINISINYVWDEVKASSKEVLKYKKTPYQIEKQRTVTKATQVPFWETIFSK